MHTYPNTILRINNYCAAHTLLAIYTRICSYVSPSAHKCTIPRVRQAQDNSPAWIEMTREKKQAGKKSNAFFEIISDRPYCARLSLSLNGLLAPCLILAGTSQPVCPYLLHLCTNIRLNASHNIAIYRVTRPPRGCV